MFKNYKSINMVLLLLALFLCNSICYAEEELPTFKIKSCTDLVINATFTENDDYIVMHIGRKKGVFASSDIIMDSARLLLDTHEIQNLEESDYPIKDEKLNPGEVVKFRIKKPIPSNGKISLVYRLGSRGIMSRETATIEFEVLKIDNDLTMKIVPIIKNVAIGVVGVAAAVVGVAGVIHAQDKHEKSKKIHEEAVNEWFDELTPESASLLNECLILNSGIQDKAEKCKNIEKTNEVTANKIKEKKAQSLDIITKLDTVFIDKKRVLYDILDKNLNSKSRLDKDIDSELDKNLNSKSRLDKDIDSEIKKLVLRLHLFLKTEKLKFEKIDSEIDQLVKNLCIKDPGASQSDGLNASQSEGFNASQSDEDPNASQLEAQSVLQLATNKQALIPAAYCTGGDQ